MPITDKEIRQVVVIGAVATLLGVLPGGSSPVTDLTATLGRRGKRRAVVVNDLLGGL